MTSKRLCEATSTSQWKFQCDSLVAMEANKSNTLLYIPTAEKYLLGIYLLGIWSIYRKWNEIVSILCCKRCSAIPFFTFIHTVFWYAWKRRTTHGKWKKTNKIELMGKKPSRNDVISSKDRQWWKSNAMHHWALFHLYVVSNCLFTL